MNLVKQCQSNNLTSQTWRYLPLSFLTLMAFLRSVQHQDTNCGYCKLCIHTLSHTHTYTHICWADTCPEQFSATAGGIPDLWIITPHPLIGTHTHTHTHGSTVDVTLKKRERFKIVTVVPNLYPNVRWNISKTQWSVQENLLVDYVTHIGTCEQAFYIGKMQHYLKLQQCKMCHKMAEKCGTCWNSCISKCETWILGERGLENYRWMGHVHLAFIWELVMNLKLI